MEEAVAAITVVVGMVVVGTVVAETGIMEMAARATDGIMTGMAGVGVFITPNSMCTLNSTMAIVPTTTTITMTPATFITMTSATEYMGTIDSR